MAAFTPALQRGLEAFNEDSDRTQGTQGGWNWGGTASCVMLKWTFTRLQPRADGTRLLVRAKTVWCWPSTPGCLEAACCGAQPVLELGLSWPRLVGVQLGLSLTPTAPVSPAAPCLGSVVDKVTMGTATGS